MEGAISSDTLLKEFREKERATQVEKEKKVPLSKKLETIRNFTDFYWIEQELEAKLDSVKREMARMEEQLEDLKAVRGNLDKIRKAKYWSVETETGKKMLPGKDSADAKKVHQESERKKREFQEKQKDSNSSKKKAKLDSQ
jgi:hypothetical protein